LVETSPINSVNFLLIETLKGGSIMKRGSVHHNRWVCRLCREGDKNTILHPHHYVQIYLPYLRPGSFRISGEKKNNPFENGVKAYIYLEKIQEAVEEESFINNKSFSIDLISFFDLNTVIEQS